MPLTMRRSYQHLRHSCVFLPKNLHMTLLMPQRRGRADGLVMVAAFAGADDKILTVLSGIKEMLGISIIEAMGKISVGSITPSSFLISSLSGDDSSVLSL